MAKPNSRTIRKEIALLRAICENPGSDATLARMAYAVEHAIRWATEDTEGWPKPSVEVELDAEYIRARSRDGLKASILRVLTTS